VLLVLVVVLAIGALLFKTLGDASLFFKNVDEAVSQRSSLGEKRFRMQGTVVPGTIRKSDDGLGPSVFFSVSFNGVLADVASSDTPTELFKDGIPVVLEGAWKSSPPAGTFADGARDGWYFASDRILVKHDANYESEEKARLKQAEDGGKVAAYSGATGGTGGTVSTGGVPATGPTGAAK
jgi:cytochrome c-type biogenesis protein CcmE